MTLNGIGRLAMWTHCMLPRGQCSKAISSVWESWKILLRHHIFTLNLSSHVTKGHHNEACLQAGKPAYHILNTLRGKVTKHSDPVVVTHQMAELTFLSMANVKCAILHRSTFLPGWL